MYGVCEGGWWQGHRRQLWSCCSQGAGQGAFAAQLLARLAKPQDVV